MKIAIPVKLNRENPPVAPLFGKAKWFAFVEEGKVEIKANPMQGGHAVIAWFMNEGVDTIILQEIGLSPYQMLQSHGGMKLYHSGFERILIEDLLEKFSTNELDLLDDSKLHAIIARYERRHSHSHHSSSQHKEKRHGHAHY